MRDEHTDLHMLSMPQELLGMQLGVSNLCTHASPDSLPSTSHTKDFRVVQNTTTDNDKQCIKLYIIDKTKQKGSFNLWCMSKQWLVNGKMNFFSWFPGRVSGTMASLKLTI